MNNDNYDYKDSDNYRRMDQVWDYIEEQKENHMQFLSDDDLDYVSGGSKTQIEQLRFIFNSLEEDAYKILNDEFQISVLPNNSGAENIYFDKNGNPMNHRDVIYKIASKKYPDQVDTIMKMFGLE